MRIIFLKLTLIFQIERIEMPENEKLQDQTHSSSNAIHNTSDDSAMQQVSAIYTEMIEKLTTENEKLKVKNLHINLFVC